MTFDIEFEESILSRCLRDADYLKSAIRICDAHHFGSKERSWIWTVTRDTWMKYRELPTPKLVAHRAKDEFDPEKRNSYLKVASRLFKLRVSGAKAALEELEKFVRFVNVQIAAEKMVDALEKNDVEAAESALRSASGVTVGERKYSLINWIEEFEERQRHRKYEKEHPEAVAAIQTGWKTIDKITGGVRPGELALIMGTTGRGKSLSLNNIAKHAAGRGKNVLMIGFEMPARQIAARQDSLWLEVEYLRLKNFDLMPSDLRSISYKHKKASKHYADKIKIASFPVGAANINDVRGLVDDLWVDQEWRPDLIMLDSADHIKAIDSKRGDIRLQHSEVYWSVKAMAEDDGFAIWSSVHAGAKWADKRATAEATAESYDKARIADLVISINDPSANGNRAKAKIEIEGFDDDEEELDSSFEVDVASDRTKLLEFYIAKYRDGESHRQIDMVADFHVMKLTERE